MAEQKESSVLFSLKELMNLEEDRIRQEDEEKKQRAEADARARSDAERRARERDHNRGVGNEPQLQHGAPSEGKGSAGMIPGAGRVRLLATRPHVGS